MSSKESPLYSNAFKDYQNNGKFKLGPLSSNKLREDQQYVMFQMSRYKHAARILENKKNVLDIGSGDGIGIPILCQYFEKVTSTDIDENMLFHARNNLADSLSCEFILNNFYEKSLQEKYDAAFCFDVLSLIDPSFEQNWITNICKSLKGDGILILGTQNKNSIKYGNPRNHLDQPNFKTYEELNLLFSSYFTNTLIFSMNDETIHTGKRNTAQYFIALGIAPKHNP